MTRDDKVNRIQAIRQILAEFEKHKAVRRAAEKKKAQQERYWTGVRIVTQVIGISACIFMAVNIAAGLFGNQGLLQEKQPWVSGVMSDKRDRAVECVRALWQVRQAIDQFYVMRKQFPQDLGELYEQGVLSRRVVCPLSGKPYTVLTVGSKQVFSCPNPQAHGVRALWLDIQSGPPEVE